ncbi:TonB-dependent receptor domain-containing protein [Sphingomonas hengshuiensis]|uniref:TonB-dependent receptor domain-containing protein n=1 Tax=Sphingomonas hengshuiensis TaxID=1609977 RepID=UPI0005C91ACD|nr:TonB-dependent receptor [Sphingomonas hengshuiensis]
MTVTGSRIVRDGYSAPTPVSVLTSADIQAQAPANLADFVNQLPSIAGSTTPASSTGSLSGGAAGINAINLRGLGAGRTLVLLDGQRSVASTATGLVDVNTFPQQLVERVEIVTGGASAAYGSDAIGGVVNFILDKSFKGLKMSAETGITDYGDGEFYKLSATGGLSLMDDRLKIIASAEYFELPGIHYIDRDWNQQGYFHITNPDYVAGNGKPERYVGYNIGPSNATPGGLITSGPLRGTVFGQIDPATGRATTSTLNFGKVSGAWMIGGDWQATSENWVGVNSFQPGQERIGTFGRVSFELTPDIEVFAQGSFNRDEGYSVYISSINAGNLSIRRDNAFLPASVRAAMVANNLQTITVGTSNEGIPPGTATNIREVTRYVVGANGNFDALGSNWKWDAYYQSGKSKLNENLINTWNNTRIANATDSIYAPAGNAEGVAAGTVTCRINADSNLSNNDAACVPLNRIGTGGVTQAALDYVLGTPYRLQTITQKVGALTFSGNPFALPAGPVSVAFGGEYREEKVDGFVEERYKTGWQYGNYLPNVGGYNVKEAFLEVAVPIFSGLDLNAAGRYTSYSTSGDVQTWKVGATYAPLSDIKFRGTISHDIRAPNLDELFAAGTGRSNTVIINGASAAYQQLATGNRDLKPEVADSWSAGLVFTPTFLPGFAFSADYYRVEISEAIGSLQPQTVADLCYLQNVAAQCANITTLSSGLLQIKLAPFNFSKQLSRGLDFEASYRMSLGSGNLSLRALATHYIENLVDNGLEAAQDTAGTNDATNGGGPPHWIYRLNALYEIDPFKFSLIGRGVSAGVINNSYIECTSNCPVSTVEHRTINNNHVDGQFWLDASVTTAFDALGALGEFQISVSNIFNSDPVLVARGPTGNSAPSFPATNQTLYDMYGRTYRATFRIKF